MTRIFLILFVVVVAYACVEPFNAEHSFNETNFLVVEGYINVGGGKSTFQISRTQQPDQTIVLQSEKRAYVRIEGEDGSRYTLTEVSDGVYQSDDLMLPFTQKYRLSITTTREKNYVSEFVEPLKSPGIDQVGWRWQPNGLTISVSTQHTDNTEKYFRWNFEEVWEFHSAFRTFFSYSNQSFHPRPLEESELMYRCWKYGYPTRLLTASTEPIEGDVVSNYPLTFIPQGDDRMSYKYSINVSQRILSKSEYEFLELLERNTNNVGSFFDPQPSESIGNLTCVTSPGEPIVGYVGCASTETKRIFIYPHELPSWNYDPFCYQTEIANHPDSIAFYFVRLGWIPTRGATFQFPQIDPLTYYAAPRSCVDCRERGGFTVEPDFWNN